MPAETPPSPDRLDLAIAESHRLMDETKQLIDQPRANAPPAVSPLESKKNDIRNPASIRRRERLRSVRRQSSCFGWLRAEHDLRQGRQGNDDQGGYWQGGALTIVAVHIVHIYVNAIGSGGGQVDVTTLRDFLHAIS